MSLSPLEYLRHVLDEAARETGEFQSRSTEENGDQEAG